jgi:hypothetical protein
VMLNDRRLFARLHLRCSCLCPGCHGETAPYLGSRAFRPVSLVKLVGAEVCRHALHL